MNIRKAMAGLLPAVLCLALLLGGCAGDATGGDSRTESAAETSFASARQARQAAVDRWQAAPHRPDTVLFLESVYGQYPDDATVKNLYFYGVAKQQYEYFETVSDDRVLDTVRESAAHIDPAYTGALSEEMQAFANSLIPAEERAEQYRTAETREARYNRLTNADKKDICAYIQERYDAYDKLEGSYAGDKYSDRVMQEAAARYGLSVSQIELIWANYYSY